MTLVLFLQVLALVLLILAAIAPVSAACASRVNLGWAGMACWLASLMLR